MVEIDDGTNTIEGEVVGVVSFDEYLGCMVFKAKVDEINKIIGQCVASIE